LRIDTENYYRKYGPMVLRRCRQLLRDEERARDAMHDVFVKLLRYQDRLEDSAPSSLLYRIATNVCLNYIRAARRRPEVAGDSMVEHIAHGASPESAAATRGLLARLFGSEVESTAVIAMLHHHDGMTLDEVAREVGMSVSGVRKRLRRLRDRVPEHVLGAGGTEP
jgi:RNA polymerase sigma-70 factor, ECF subfamily